MKLFFVFLFILSAFFAEYALSRMMGFVLVTPPLTLLAVFYRLWHAQKNEAFIVLAIAIFLLESVSLFSPGSYAVVLLILTSLIAAFRSYVTNVDSVFAQIIAAALFILSALFFVQGYGALRARMHGGAANFDVLAWQAVLWIVLWSAAGISCIHFVKIQRPTD